LSRTRWGVQAVLALLVGVIITLAGGAVFYFVSTMAVDPDPAAVPSTPGVHTERYAAAIAESRRLARALLLQDNLPGLSVAVSRNGEILWTEASAGQTSKTVRRSAHAHNSVLEAYRKR